jgi:hypothetical protein
MFKKDSIVSGTHFYLRGDRHLDYFFSLCLHLITFGFMRPPFFHVF